VISGRLLKGGYSESFRRHGGQAEQRGVAASRWIDHVHGASENDQNDCFVNVESFFSSFSSGASFSFRFSEQFIGAFGINVSQFSAKFYPKFFSVKKAMHIESYVHESAENS